MSNRTHLVLLYGGNSGEHDVSLRSAASVLANLDADRYRITPIGMDKDGLLYVNDYQELLQYPDALPVATAGSCRLDSLLLNGRLAVDADVVFPVIHGPLYEDGCLQGVLRWAHVAYVGCDVLSSAIGMDKDMARRIVGLQGVQSARYRALTAHASATETMAFCQQTSLELGWPLFVKPNSMGSSVGIHKAHNMAELLLAVSDAKRYDETVLVEECIKGREIELAVLEHPSLHKAPEVSVAGEIRVHHPDGFYSYTAKYLDSEQTDLTVPARLDDAMLSCLQQTARDVFVALKCKGMARVDFFISDENQAIYFNEVNTLPGFTSISMYPKLWAASGLEYADLLNRLVDLAIAHQQGRLQLVTHYQ